MKFLIILAVLLFGAIGVLAVYKKNNTATVVQSSSKAASPKVVSKSTPNQSSATSSKPAPVKEIAKDMPKSSELPFADRMDFLYTPASGFPLVETIAYQSKVDWQKGRHAWLVDYARHFKTSKHFIARSVTGKKDYQEQNLRVGDRFNVLSLDKDVEFYLVVDTSRCLMWFYGVDATNHERILLKRYKVGLGRPDDKRTSGLLTPVGRYKLGSRVAVYQPGVMGTFQNQSVEMIKIFGTRWIPFEEELEGCTAPARGFGIHGAPWTEEVAGGKLQENALSIGKYESDGCIRLATEDMEELFSIIISRPTTIEIVKDFSQARLPEKESVRYPDSPAANSVR